MGPKQRKNVAFAASKKQEEDNPMNEKKQDVAVELDKALKALEESRRAMLTLYVEWRTQLLRTSIIVMLVILYQLREPSTYCVKEIKQWNEIRKNSMEEPFTGWQALLLQ
eukprot:scaffold1223_cov119-Cylindrotheca_fusiformis.AAC.4